MWSIWGFCGCVLNKHDPNLESCCHAGKTLLCKERCIRISDPFSLFPFNSRHFQCPGPHLSDLSEYSPVEACNSHPNPPQVTSLWLSFPSRVFFKAGEGHSVQGQGKPDVWAYEGSTGAGRKCRSRKCRTGSPRAGSAGAGTGSAEQEAQEQEVPEQEVQNRKPKSRKYKSRSRKCRSRKEVEQQEAPEQTRFGSSLHHTDPEVHA